MIDETTGEPMRVSTDGGVGPYLRLPGSQVEEVCEVLDREGIYYWVQENYFSFNGGPEFGTIEFGRKGDAERIQQALDAAHQASREMSHEPGG